MSDLLAGKRAIVTGGARGIGLAIAERFLHAGASVVIADVDGGAVAKSGDSLRSAFDGDRVAEAQLDVTDAAAMSQLVDTTVERWGGLEVMVNNAGITRDATLRNLTMDDWQLVIQVHLTGTYLGIKEAARVMREAKSGSIISISSIAGKVGMVGQANYSAAKAGIVGLTKTAAKELAHHGVRVNAVQPGLIRTRMTEAMREDIWEEKLSQIPMQRAGQPEDVANVVLFYASGLSNYVTGTCLEVTGGRFM